MANMRPNSRTLLKVVILGDGGVGKSCLMNRFVSNRYDENNFHTIGVEFMNKEILVDGEKYTLQIWDTAGQERFRALRTPFYRGTDICMLCYAVDDRDTFLGLKQWRDEFRNYADIRVDTFPFIVVGNKNDLSARYRQVQFDEVQSWCADNGISSHIETSSKAATNVSEAFMLAVRQWKHMERAAEADLRRQNNNDIIDLTKRIRLAQSRFCCYGSSGSEAGRPGAGDSDTEDEYMSSTSAPSATTTPRRFGLRPAKQEPVRYEL